MEGGRSRRDVVLVMAVVVPLVEIRGVFGCLGGVAEDAAARMEGRSRAVRMKEGGIYGLDIQEVELVKSRGRGKETSDAR